MGGGWWWRWCPLVLVLASSTSLRYPLFPTTTHNLTPWPHCHHHRHHCYFHHHIIITIIKSSSTLSHLHHSIPYNLTTWPHCHHHRHRHYCCRHITITNITYIFQSPTILSISIRRLFEWKHTSSMGIFAMILGKANISGWKYLLMARRNICSNIEKCQCSWNLCPAVIQLLALSWKAHSITVIIVNWSRNLFIILTFRFHELLPLRGKADDFRYSILCCSTEIRYSHHFVSMLRLFIYYSPE